MHKMKKKIYYHDTDAGGVVYYSNYLKYFEESRTEFLQDKGISVERLAEEGTLFVVKKVEIDYKTPARYGDDLIVTAEISKVKNVTLEFTQCVMRDKQMLVCAKTQLVCIDLSFRPKAMGAEITKLL